jgi:hypothetical protein
MICIESPYIEFDCLKTLPKTFQLGDNLGGFDQQFSNVLLSKLQHYAELTNTEYTIHCDQIIEQKFTDSYPNLKIFFDLQYHKRIILNFFHGYQQHPEIDYKNFICSFNGGEHVSRTLLVAILKRFNYFNSDYCSKNFVFTIDKLDGYIQDFVSDQDCFYQKFFISNDGAEFFQTNHSFQYERFKHDKNIYNLESKLTESFLHIVSESMATSYVPFVTEKFLYSIVTRGLFLSYAQPGWHNHLERHYGFKKYTKLFDYRFDTIQNPVVRLVELMSMISKFSMLTTDDWHDLYNLEHDTVEYNYDHYFSGAYIKCLENYTRTIHVD